MLVREILDQAKSQFKEREISEVDAEILLAHLLDTDRMQLQLPKFHILLKFRAWMRSARALYLYSSSPLKLGLLSLYIVFGGPCPEM